MDMMFIFDERSSEWNSTCQEFNEAFAKAQMEHMADIVKNRHWLYLRELFDAFGMDATMISPIMGWNGENAELEYEIRSLVDGGKPYVAIHHNAKAMA